MTSVVNTSTGPVDLPALGRTLMHEHTIVRFAGADWDYAVEPAEVQLPRVIGCLEQVKAAGIATIVDAAPADLGRNAEAARAASEAAGVNVVCSTGLYSCFRLPHYDNPYYVRDADALARNFVRELEVGIGDTGIRAGVIKVATPLGEVGEYAERALRAAARAQLKTGAPIITHTEGGTLGPAQVEVFASEGASLGHVVIGHNDTADLDYLLRIVDAGAVLGFDRMSNEKFLPEADRMRMLLALLERRYEAQIVLSSDRVGGQAGGPGYTHVPETVVPALAAAGVTDEAISAMLVDNPRRILAGAR